MWVGSRGLEFLSPGAQGVGEGCGGAEDEGYAEYVLKGGRFETFKKHPAQATSYREQQQKKLL